MTDGITMTNAVIECILSRSAAKYYDPAATLSDDQICELVRIGTTAPTSFHLQNWRFIAVRTSRKSQTERSGEDAMSGARLKHYGWGREDEGMTAEEQAFVLGRYLCVPKTLSELMTPRNHLSWRNDRAPVFRRGRLGLANQSEDPARG
jgi:nitroreductase